MSARVAAVRSRTFAALRQHNYRLYFFSQIVSMSGSWMQNIAQSWLVLELTGSGTALGTVVALQMLPVLLVGPICGVFADRFDKQRLIITTQAAKGVLSLALGILVVTGSVELWMVYVFAVSFGSVTALDNPARHTFVMELVGPETIANAVVLNSVVVNSARVIGPAIGGVIIATLGTGVCFLLDGFSFLAVIISMAMIRRAELHRSDRAPRGRGQLREGLRYAWGNPDLRTTLIMLVIIGTLAYEFRVTMPLLAEVTFDSGSTGLAYITALMGAGAVVGGLVTASFGNPTPKRFASVAAAFGTVLLAISVMPTLVLACVLMPVLGAASVAVISLSNATLQLGSASAMRGRVMALFSVALLGSTPIGGPAVGYLAEQTNPRVAIAVGGLAAVAAAAYGWSQLSDSVGGGRRTEIPDLPIGAAAGR